jgi:hypothetical protein
LLPQFFLGVCKPSSVSARVSDPDPQRFLFGSGLPVLDPGAAAVPEKY